MLRPKESSIVRYLRCAIATLFVCLLQAPAQSQTKFEEKPGEHERYRYEMIKYEDGTIPDIWREFQRTKSKHLNTLSSLPSAQWVCLGPDAMDSLGGRMTCLAFNPFNAETLLAGSAAGGLWKSSDGGDSWHVLTDKLPSLRISCVAYNPQDSNHIIIGTGFYYNDQYALLPGIGMLESLDGGKTWNQTSLAFPYNEGVSINRIVWDKRNPNNIYVAATNGLWVSRTMGKSYSLTLSGGFSDLDIVPSSPNVLYASEHSVGIHKSIDSGVTWKLLKNGLPDSVFRINLALCEGFPNFILASIINPNDYSSLGVFKSPNGGESWEKMQNIPDYACLGANGGCFGWFVNQVAISPVDTNLIFLAGLKFYRTTDGGANWQLKDYYLTVPKGPFIGLTYVDQFDFAFNPSAPSIAYACNDGGVFKSTDAGGFWHKKNKGLVTALIYQFASCSSDSTKLICALQDQGLQYVDNTDGNISWNLWNYGDGSEVAYDPHDVSKVYGSAGGTAFLQNNNVTNGYKSTLSFRAGILGTTQNWLNFTLVHHPTISNKLYTADDSRIYKSTNGTSWVAIAQIPNVKALTISEKNPNTLYAASFEWNNPSTHRFYVSHNDGETWDTTESSPGWRVSDIEADPTIYGTVYAIRNPTAPGRPRLSKSTNHGDSWTPLSDGLPDVSTNAITVNPYNANMVYVATDLGVYISEDAATTWKEYNDNLPPYYVMDMHYHRMDSTLRVATMGRGVWKTKSLSPSIVSAKDDATFGGQLQLSPIPSTDVIQIKADITTSANYSIHILNTLGQRLYTLHEGYLDTGLHNFVWEGKNGVGHQVAAGIYFVELCYANRRIVRRIVKQ